MKTALICGVSGQDGAYLARFLLSRGYRVIGTSRDAQSGNHHNLTRLGIESLISFESMSLNDFRSVLQVLTKVRPDEIYNLAGQSSVGHSFEIPVETLESIATATLNLLEVIRFIERPIRLYNAGSGECFGDTQMHRSTEETPFRPRSPYAVAKATAFWEVANYREAYNLFACTGILFNHESPLRGSRFVTRKIVQSVCRIANGSKERLKLGNIDISRDWGWAPEYVDAMWRMLQQDIATDYVIATGVTSKLSDFIDLAFKECGLNWQDWVDVDHNLLRPTDLKIGYADPGKAERDLNWKSTIHLKDIVSKMISVELGQLSILEV